MNGLDENNYDVIQFVEPHLENIERFVIIPHSWIRKKTTGGFVIVAYPNEDSIKTRKRVRKNKKYRYHWQLYEGIVKYESNDYEDACNWITTNNQEKHNRDNLLEITESNIREIVSSEQDIPSSSNLMKPQMKVEPLKNNLNEPIKVSLKRSLILDALTKSCIKRGKTEPRAKKIIIKRLPSSITGNLFQKPRTENIATNTISTMKYTRQTTFKKNTKKVKLSNIPNQVFQFLDNSQQQNNITIVPENSLFQERNGSHNFPKIRGTDEKNLHKVQHDLPPIKPMRILIKPQLSQNVNENPSSSLNQDHLLEKERKREILSKKNEYNKKKLLDSPSNTSSNPQNITNSASYSREIELLYEQQYLSPSRNSIKPVADCNQTMITEVDRISCMEQRVPNQSVENTQIASHNQAPVMLDKKVYPETFDVKGQQLSHIFSTTRNDTKLHASQTISPEIMTVDTSAVHENLNVENERSQLTNNLPGLQLRKEVTTTNETLNEESSNICSKNHIKESLVNKTSAAENVPNQPSKKPIVRGFVLQDPLTKAVFFSKSNIIPASQVVTKNNQNKMIIKCTTKKTRPIFKKSDQTSVATYTDYILKDADIRECNCEKYSEKYTSSEKECCIQNTLENDSSLEKIALDSTKHCASKFSHKGHSSKQILPLNQDLSFENSNFLKSSDKNCIDQDQSCEIDIENKPSIIQNTQIPAQNSFQSAPKEKNIFIPKNFSLQEMSTKQIPVEKLNDTINNGNINNPENKTESIPTTSNITQKPANVSLDNNEKIEQILKDDFNTLFKHLDTTLVNTCQVINTTRYEFINYCDNIAQPFQTIITKVNDYCYSRLKEIEAIDTEITAKKTILSTLQDTIGNTHKEIEQNDATKFNNSNNDGDNIQTGYNKNSNHDNNCQYSHIDNIITLNADNNTSNDNNNNNNHDNRIHNDQNIEPSTSSTMKLKSRNTFVLPPEYDPNDTKWTLKYRNAGPGIVELIPSSGVYISAFRFAYCKRVARDYKTLARLLFTEIFSLNALTICSLTGSRAKAFDSVGTNVRPGLDEHARMVILTFVEEYGTRKNWQNYSTESIINSVRCKIQEIRTRYGSKVM